MVNRREFLKKAFKLAGGGILGYTALLKMGIFPDEAQAILRGSTVGGGGCSGTYGNQLTTDAGYYGNGNSGLLLSKITGACDGNTASVSLRFSYFNSEGEGFRGSAVIYSDDTGEPANLLGSAVITGVANGAYSTLTTNLVVDTNSTTFWIGTYCEGAVGLGYSATTGGASAVRYGCTSAYNSPPATFTSEGSNDNDEDAHNFESYVTY